jgi:transposase-like protein
MITQEEYIKALQIVQEYEKQLNISDVSWRSEQLVCPNCGSYAIDSTHSNKQHDCFDCGESWAN